MSSYSLIADGRRLGKAPEKSNFVQTCNLLSRYIKEKGSLRDLNLEIGGKVESLEAIARIIDFSTSLRSNNKVKSAQPSTDQHPPITPHDSSINTAEHAPHKQTSKEAMTADPKTAQLTIFYSGKVLVFDDYPADKARELMAFAKKGSSKMSYGILSNTLGEKPSPGGAVAPAPASASCPRDGLPPRPQASSYNKGVGISPNTCKEKPNAAFSGAVASNSRAEERASSQPEANGSDLPIARRSSLHRFLAKRKDRAAGGGPYHQVQEQAAASPCKGDEGQLELKL